MKNEDDVMRKDLPDEEFRDFLASYDETAWIEKEKQSSKKIMQADMGITEEIKEEDEEKSSDGSDKDDFENHSPTESLNQEGKEEKKDGNEDEDVYPSLEEALEMEFDINQVTKLE